MKILKSWYSKVVNLKIRISTVLIAGYIIFSGFKIYNQNLSIKIYEVEFSNLDQLVNTQQERMDSLKLFLNQLSIQEVFYGNIEKNLVEEYLKLQNEPLLFAKEYLSSRQTSLGGGD